MKYSLAVSIGDLPQKERDAAAAEMADFARAAGELLYMGGVVRLLVADLPRATLGALVVLPEGGLVLEFPAGLFLAPVPPPQRFFLYFRGLAHAFNRARQPPGGDNSPLAELRQIYLEFYAQQFAAQAVQKLLPQTGEPWEALGLADRAAPFQTLARAWPVRPAPGLGQGAACRVLLGLCGPDCLAQGPALGPLRLAMAELFQANSFALDDLLPLYLSLFTA